MKGGREGGSRYNIHKFKYRNAHVCFFSLGYYLETQEGDWSDEDVTAKEGGQGNVTGSKRKAEKESE